MVVQIRTHAQKYFQKLAKARQNSKVGDISMEGRGNGPGDLGIDSEIERRDLIITACHKSTRLRTGSESSRDTKRHRISDLNLTISILY